MYVYIYIYIYKYIHRDIDIEIDRVDLILWITRKIAADPWPPHDLAEVR